MASAEGKLIGPWRLVEGPIGSVAGQAFQKLCNEDPSVGRGNGFKVAVRRRAFIFWRHAHLRISSIIFLVIGFKWAVTHSYVSSGPAWIGSRVELPAATPISRLATSRA